MDRNGGCCPREREEDISEHSVNVSSDDGSNLIRIK